MSFNYYIMRPRIRNLDCLPLNSFLTKYLKKLQSRKKTPFNQDCSTHFQWTQLFYKLLQQKGPIFGYSSNKDQTFFLFRSDNIVPSQESSFYFLARINEWVCNNNCTITNITEGYRRSTDLTD